MRDLYSLLFTLFTDPLGLPISPLWEYVILLVINEIAFRVAWDASPGGIGGSTIHWTVRIISFVVIWAITYAIIWVAKFAIAHWIPIVCVVLTLLVAIIIIYRHRQRKCEF